MPPSHLRYHLLLHATVIIWGSTGLMGKLVDAPAPLMVWYRTLIAAIAIGAFIVATRGKFAPPAGLRTRLLATGLIVGTHWVLFFESVKQSTVSVTLVCLSTAPLFVALLGGLLSAHRVYRHEIALSAVSIGGVLCVFGFESQYATGITLGVASAFFAAVFVVLNSRFLSDGANSLQITFYEMLGAAAGLTVYLSLTQGLAPEAWQVNAMDFVYLLYLGIVCSAIAFLIGVYVMRVLSPFTAALTVNLEPIYGIALALIVLGDAELMSPGFYVGAAILLGSILANAFIKRRLGPA